MIWSLQSYKLIRIFKAHDKWIKSVTLNNNSNIIASGSKDETIKIWNLYSGEKIKTLTGH